MRIAGPGQGPSSTAILENAHGLARYAQICQVCVCVEGGAAVLPRCLLSAVVGRARCALCVGLVELCWALGPAASAPAAAVTAPSQENGLVPIVEPEVTLGE
jgi:hypothetical protein